MTDEHNTKFRAWFEAFWDAMSPDNRPATKAEGFDDDDLRAAFEAGQAAGPNEAPPPLPPACVVCKRTDVATPCVVPAGAVCRACFKRL